MAEELIVGLDVATKRAPTLWRRAKARLTLFVTRRSIFLSDYHQK
jgi:hypothetical protein